MKSPHVAALAEDENDSGREYIHAPTVRGEDRRLICGRDRMAGALLNKREKLWFHVIDCDDNEAAELEEKENIYRRHSEGERASALARLVALQAQKIRAEEAAASCDTVTPLGAVSARKSSQTVTAEARKMVARAAGITPAAVRQAEVRAAAKEAESAGPSTAGTLPGGSKHAPAVGRKPALTEAPLELPEKFDTFGLDVPEASRSVIVSTVEWLGDWDGQLRGLLRELSEMEKHGPYAVAPAHLQRIRERIEAAGHAVRDAIPTSLCFYCKAQPASMATCPPSSRPAARARAWQSTENSCWRVARRTPRRLTSRRRRSTSSWTAWRFCFPPTTTKSSRSDDRNAVTVRPSGARRRAGAGAVHAAAVSGGGDHSDRRLPRRASVDAAGATDGHRQDAHGGDVRAPARRPRPVAGAPAGADRAGARLARGGHRAGGIGREGRPMRARDAGGGGERTDAEGRSSVDVPRPVRSRAHRHR